MAEKPTPIKITLYDPVTNDVKAEFTRLYVPWRLLKAAVGLVKALDASNMTEDDIDRMAGLVVEAFGGQFTLDQLDSGADVSEMLAVIQQIIGKAGMAMKNPTQPQGS